MYRYVYRFRTGSEPAWRRFPSSGRKFSPAGRMETTIPLRMRCPSDILRRTGTKGQGWDGAASESARRGKKKGGRPPAAGLPPLRTSPPRTFPSFPAQQGPRPSVGAHCDASQRPKPRAEPDKTGAPKKPRRSPRRAPRLDYLPPRHILDLFQPRDTWPDALEQDHGNKNTKQPYLPTTTGAATKWGAPAAPHFQKMCPAAP